MSDDLQARFAHLRDLLGRVGQGHVFSFWPELSAIERYALLADIESLNLAELPAQSKLAAEGSGIHEAIRLEPARVIHRSSLDREVVQCGQRLITEGRVAAFTVAGGQGTRLGFDGPKGAFCISPVRAKPLFQLFAEQIQATELRYGCRMHWYIMTSPSNDLQTREFFRHHRWFGLDEGAVSFFQQGVMPSFDRRGKILLDDKHRVSLSPDGHGGSLLALARSGILTDMSSRGIEYISYFQVDNPLVMCIDPSFVGLHAAQGSDMSSKSVPKADDLERVGNFGMADGKLAVIEYSDLPQSLAREKNANGSRKYDAANIAIHLLSREFVERLTADAAAFALPWHRAEKKIPFVDLATGRRVEPADANGVKLESFVFDALPLARNPVLMGTSREEEFSPVKNATGVDSVETAKRDMNRRAVRWLVSAGWDIPMRSDGEPDGNFEIHPRIGLDCEHFKANSPLPHAAGAGSALYLE